MAQTPHDFFKLPFRAFGAELNPEAVKGFFSAVELASGRYVDFSITHARFQLTAAEHESGDCVVIMGVNGRLQGTDEQVLGPERAISQVDHYPRKWLARSWGELADVFEAAYIPYYQREQIDSQVADCEVLFRFIRYFETGDGAFEKYYRMVRPIFQATREELRARSLTA